MYNASLLPQYVSSSSSSSFFMLANKMKLKHSCVISLSFLTFITLTFLTTSQTCKSSCGKIPIKYPFGTGLGCGDPRFQRYVTCNQEKLVLNTHSGCYPVTTIDYTHQVIYITDPSMSTCGCTQPSKGFGLDWDAPFSFHDDTIFTLLDCSATSSPIYKTNGYNADSDSSSNTTVPQCDREGASICSFLYSCRAISMLNLPISTCCVYAPVDLGPSFEMDLRKLQCNSYSGFYSFNGQESNPNNWMYGIALKYKFNVYNDYPSSCANCERSNGVCGYGGVYNTFICNCPGGLNTTTDCFFESSFSHSPRLLPAHGTHAGNWFIYSLAMACFLVRVSL